jgi:hypothetical protein
VGLQKQKQEQERRGEEQGGRRRQAGRESRQAMSVRHRAAAAELAGLVSGLILVAAKIIERLGFDWRKV